MFGANLKCSGFWIEISAKLQVGILSVKADEDGNEEVSDLETYTGYMCIQQTEDDQTFGDN